MLQLYWPLSPTLGLLYLLLPLLETFLNQLLARPNSRILQVSTQVGTLQTTFLTTLSKVGTVDHVNLISLFHSIIRSYNHLFVCLLLFIVFISQLKCKHYGVAFAFMTDPSRIAPSLQKAIIKPGNKTKTTTWRYWRVDASLQTRVGSPTLTWRRADGELYK